MNARLAALRAMLGRNKAGLGVAGAGIVAVLAWRAHAAKGTAPAAAPAAAALPAGVSQSAGGYTDAYDSTASDVYNALQPQLEELSRLWDKTPTPIPVPAAPTPAKPTTNKAWLNQVTEGWVKQGPGHNVVDIQHAVGTWLSGQQIKGKTQYGVNWAVAQYGAPPEGRATLPKKK